jgi:hypothetical protein
LEVPVAVDPAFDPTLGLPGGNGTARRYDAGSGYGRTAGPPAMLAADADRERAIDVLKAGFAEGRLTRAEHGDRTSRVYSSRTYDELGALIADLPAWPLGHPAHHPDAGYPPRQMEQPATNSMAVAALACGIGEFLTMGLTAIPAIVLGHAARRQVRKTGQRGDGMALAGLTLGWIGLLTAIIAGLIIAASVSGHSPHPIFAHPNPGAPGGPLQGG